MFTPKSPSTHAVETGLAERSKPHTHTHDHLSRSRWKGVGGGGRAAARCPSVNGGSRNSESRPSRKLGATRTEWELGEHVSRVPGNAKARPQRQGARSRAVPECKWRVGEDTCRLDKGTS